MAPGPLLQLFYKRTENRQLAVAALTMEPDERESGKGVGRAGGSWSCVKPSLFRVGLPRGKKGRAGVPGDERMQRWVPGLILKLLADPSGQRMAGMCWYKIRRGVVWEELGSRG